MHVVEKTTVVLTSVPRVHRVLKFTMDFVPCKLHGDDRGDNTVTTRGRPGDNTVMDMGTTRTDADACVKVIVRGEQGGLATETYFTNAKDGKKAIA